MIRDGRVRRLGKGAVQRYPSDSVVHFAAPKILEPVFWAFDRVQCYFPPVLELYTRRLTSADHQVATNVQVSICIQAENLVEAVPREPLQDQSGTSTGDKLTSHSVRALGESDNSDAARGRTRVTKHPVPDWACGLTKHAVTSCAGIINPEYSTPTGAHTFSDHAVGEAAGTIRGASHSIPAVAGPVLSNYPVAVGAARFSDGAISETAGAIRHTAYPIPAVAGPVLSNYPVAVGAGRFSDGAISETAGSIRHTAYPVPAAAGPVLCNHAIAVGAEGFTNDAVGEAAGGIRIAGNAGTAAAEAVSPHAKRGPARSGRGLSSHSNPVDTLAINAGSLAVCREGVAEYTSSEYGRTLPVDTIRVAGSRRGIAGHAVPARAGTLPIDAIEVTRSRRAVTKHPCEVRALSVYTDASICIGGNSGHSSSCSGILAEHAVLVARSGSGGRETDQAASACAADRSGHQTRPASILADQYHLVAGRATERGRRKHGP